MEELWEALYREHSLDPATGASGIELAEALLGPGCVRILASAPCESVLVPVSGGRSEIRLRAGLPLERENGLLAHEAMEYAIGGYVGDDIEAVVNRAARSALMPPLAFVRALEEHDGDLVGAAARFVVQPQHAILRLGELGIASVAILLGGRLCRRDPLRRLPSAQELKRIAAAPEWAPASFEVVPLHDATGVALVRWPDAA